MNRLDELVKTSMEEYRVLLEKTRELSERLGALSARESVEAYRGVIELQRACRSTDETLVPLLKKSAPVQGLVALVAQRMQLMEEVVAEHRRLMPMLLSRRAILSAELNTSREGQTAMAGYRSNGPVSGRILSRAC